MNIEEILSYEDFERFNNNFHLHFVGHPENAYREASYFLKFQMEYEEFEKDLSGDFTPRWLAWKDSELGDGLDTPKPDFMERFYDAYQKMRVFVETDHELGILR